MEIQAKLQSEATALGMMAWLLLVLVGAVVQSCDGDGPKRTRHEKKKTRKGAGGWGGGGGLGGGGFRDRGVSFWFLRGVENIVVSRKNR